MISKSEALTLISSYLEVLSDDIGVPLVLLEEQTLESAFAWVFFYQSQAFLMSNDFSDRLVGNAPVIVSRTDGSIHETGTAHPIETYLASFEKHGDPFREL